jgi:hypothetical protein
VLPEHAGLPVKNSVLSWSEKALAIFDPVASTWPFSLIAELTSLNVPVALEIVPDTCAE